MNGSSNAAGDKDDRGVEGSKDNTDSAAAGGGNAKNYKVQF